MNGPGHDYPGQGEEVQAALRATGTGDLLTTFARLTHRMHDAPELSWTDAPSKAELRAQRDLIRAEILRRTGDA